jgi:hypothetical protein
MVVEPESLCWVSGRLTDAVTGTAWADPFRHLPALAQVTRDGGSSLAKGVATVQEERQEHGQPALADQRDHFPTLRGGSQGVRKALNRVRSAVVAADDGQAALDRRRRHGQSENGFRHKARDRWAKASHALNTWQERDETWQKTKAALPLVTPEGDLNTRARAEAILAETVPQVPDADFAQPKRRLQQPQTLTYLDDVHRQFAALPVPEEAWRASSLVECINSVLGMQQARHRKMSQGLLDLKRLSGNCHTFRSGRRRGRTP